MLPHEIEPYANMNIANLEKVVAALEKLESTPEIEEAIQFVKIATSGFYRFKACMADEVRQKTPLTEKIRFCMLNHY